MFNKKYSVSILDENWGEIVATLNLQFIPRKDELIWLEKFQQYFMVLKIVHYLNEKQGIFIVVKTLEGSPDQLKIIN